MKHSLKLKPTTMLGRYKPTTMLGRYKPTTMLGRYKPTTMLGRYKPTILLLKKLRHTVKHKNQYTILLTLLITTISITRYLYTRKYRATTRQPHMTHIIGENTTLKFKTAMGVSYPYLGCFNDLTNGVKDLNGLSIKIKNFKVLKELIDNGYTIISFNLIPFFL